MAKKPGKKKSGKKKTGKKKSPKNPPKKVSVGALHREINRVLEKMDGATTKSAEGLRNKLITFQTNIDCGQTLVLDIS